MLKTKINPSQNDANVFVVSKGDTGCCGDTATACKYTIAMASGDAITAITVISPKTGASKVLTIPSTLVSNLKGLRKELLKALKAEGFIETEGKTFNYTGTALEIFSEQTISSVTVAGSPVAATVACVPKLKCIYEFTTAGGAGKLLVVNASSTSTSWVFGTTALNVIETAVTNAFNSGGGAGTVGKCTAVVNGANNAWIITVAAYGEIGVTFDAKNVDPCCCVADFTAA